MFSIAIHPILLVAVLLTFFSLFLSSIDGAIAQRQHKTQKKAAHPNNSDEYDYRVDDDYSIGVFVDAVPIAKNVDESAKTPQTNEDGKAYKRTNRYPTKKLRRFFDESKARREWYESLFSRTAERRRR
ncbi:hypothetical protein niasHT_014040 [Heterodera trifolii]|uniref:Uncharacterized protein n=1 Tax=Heterodera trifolii TaxID=157864 RepID=A0ABD2LG81_9BILA